MSRDYDDKEKREERREKREERREKKEEKRESEPAHVNARRHGLLEIIDTMKRCILFCFSIVAQRPRVSPPSRLGAADGLWVPLAHGLMRTHCDEQKRHWYCIMDFATHTSGSGMAECRAPADERRKIWFERDKNTMERNNREANTSATARTSTSGGGHDKKEDLLSSSFPFLSL